MNAGSLYVSVSILNADFLRLGEQVQIINSSAADWLHLDIMDGVFVPNISYGLPVTEALAKASTKPLDVHLMIVEPEKYIERFAKAGAFLMTVHYEACRHLHSTVQAVKSLKCKVGVALNPHTEVSLLRTILPDLDLALVMSVNPGFGGQKFIAGTFEKVRELRTMADTINPGLIIQVDGGVSVENVHKLKESGVSCVVAGTSVFRSNDPRSTISTLKI